MTFSGSGKLDCTDSYEKGTPIASKDGQEGHHQRSGRSSDLDFAAVLGYIDPGITVNIIRDGKLLKREHLSPFERVTGIIKCKNPAASLRAGA